MLFILYSVQDGLHLILLKSSFYFSFLAQILSLHPQRSVAIIFQIDFLAEPLIDSPALVTLLALSCAFRPSLLQVCATPAFADSYSPGDWEV